MAELGKQESVDMNDLELEVKQVKVVDGTNATAIIKGAVVGTLSTDVIGTTAADVYLIIEIGGTEYKFVGWQDD